MSSSATPPGVTPRPWRLQPCHQGGAILLRGGADVRSHPQTHLQVVPREDAEFIVRAVNAHDALCDAVQALVRSALNHNRGLTEALEDAKRALDLAEGDTPEGRS